MKYMLLIYFTEKADLSESERQDLLKRIHTARGSTSFERAIRGRQSTSPGCHGDQCSGP